MIIDLDYSYRPKEMIMLGFQTINIGSLMTISCRLWDTTYIPMPFGYLPDRAEPPYAFSLKQTITDALNAVCIQAPDNMDELPAEVQQALAKESEGQGMWKWVDLKIEDNEIIAVVKKI